MIEHVTHIRVRYGETDTMGFVYYGNYPLYYEVGRTELMRSLGIPYKILEDKGIILPVTKMEATYYAPAKYDDLLTIKTRIEKRPGVRITFHYLVYREDSLLNEGTTVLAFTDAKQNRPLRPSDELESLWDKYFKR
ncbi:MAG: thioesterase family protein [Bacteroidales bacterium]|jgi:acyl-CoA thioester hydrolase